MRVLLYDKNKNILGKKMKKMKRENKTIVTHAYW